MATDNIEDGPVERERFPWASEVDIPKEMDGWKELYPDYFVFDRTEERTQYEHEHFWFWDKTHCNEPVAPWDMSVNAEAWQMTMGQNPSRVFAVPPAMSIEIRVLGGYMFWAAIGCEDPDLLEERQEVFAERSQYVYENYDGLSEGIWKPAVREIGHEIRNLEVPQELPRYVPDETVVQAKGQSQDTLSIIENYNRLTELVMEGYQRHFEFLHLAFLAYLTFRETCEELFPGISEDTIGKMVSGLEPDLIRPDEELNDLAELAVELGEDVLSVLKSDRTTEKKISELEEMSKGQEFMEAFNDSKDPWFHLSYGDGLSHKDGSWIDDLETPFEHLKAKVQRLEEGKEIGRDFEELRAERNELVDEYRSYLETEEELEQFNQAFETCISIYEYAEDHQFWIEHWLHTEIFAKMREFGQLATTEGLIEEPDDIFLFTKFEVAELLEEVCETWSLGPNGFVPTHWKKKAIERKQILEAAHDWTPPSFLGEPPEQITDPTLIMSWGITTDRVYEELQAESQEGPRDSLSGFASSSGTVEGKARVLSSTDELSKLEDGEILVAHYTNPAWAPVFPRIAGAITDDGGITSHAAIVCREYGVPAVTGTGSATSEIETGDHIRVDGAEGTVEILERAN